MRLLPFLAVPVVALTLTACSATSATPVPANTSSAETPAFATDEEALAAAQAAYAEYLQVSDQIAREGGANPERLTSLLSEDLYKSQAATYQSAQSTGVHAEGQSTFTKFKIQRISDTELSNYVCLDVQNIRVVNGKGEDVTPVDRPGVLPMALTWAISNDKLTLITSDVWTGENFC